jgi:hypothetical protein
VTQSKLKQYVPAVELMASQAKMEMDEDKDNQNSTLSPALGNFLAFLFLFKSHLDSPYQYLPSENVITEEKRGLMSTKEREMSNKKTKASFISD